MSLSNHWPDCWRQEDHPACRLAYIHLLKIEILRLKTQLQYERTGHLVEYPPLYADHFGMPCGHDHIDPPIVSGGPTWAHRSDEPPSLTP